MFSNYDKRGYLRARRRQERMAETLSGSDPTDTQIKAFMRREERLQTYEFIAHQEKTLKARLEKTTFVEYVEKVLDIIRYR